MTREETVAAILADTDVCDLETVVEHLGRGECLYVVVIDPDAKFAEVAARVLNDLGDPDDIRRLFESGTIKVLDRGMTNPEPDVQVVPYRDMGARCEVRCLAAPPAFLVQPTGRLRR